VKFRTLLIDPPWPQPLSGKRKRAKGSHGADALPYPTMTLEEITSLPVGDLADTGCHLWLWTTNSFLEQGFSLMRHWGFKTLAPIHWIKPSGCGNYVIHRTQTVLFGYKEKCIFEGRRYFPNILQINTWPKRHSEKPVEFYELIESVSPAPRLEMFARSVRPGWDVWGNEVDATVQINLRSHLTLQSDVVL
jgi:N6-adenosine-specific RNA methylase IME4